MPRLILSRKVGERIVIADEVIVSVNNIKGGKVSLAIEASTLLSVDRYEVWADKKSKKEASSDESAA